MRYQGLSPENLPLSNGRKSHWRTCKEEDGIIGSREIDDDSTKTIPTFVEGHKGIPRFRSPSSKTQDQNFSPYTGSVPNSPPQPKNNHHHQHEMNNNSSPVHNGDVLLQWGHRKRSRLSRSIESRAAGTAGGMTVTTDDSSSSSSTQIQAMINVKRRSISLPTPVTGPVPETKNAANIANTNIMPPPSSLLPTISITAAANITSTSNGKGGSLKSCSKYTSAFVNRRNSEERSAHPPRNGGGSSRTGVAAGGAAASSSRSKLGKRSPPSKVIEKHDHKRSITTTCTTGPTFSSASLRGDDKLNGFLQQEQGGGIGTNHHKPISCAPLQEAGCGTTTTSNCHDDDNVNASAKTTTTVAAEKAANGGGEVNEWPRVYIPLTRKEKEEDFLVMKGTKLPHRPKKRPKAVDRMLQYCFPGMWLSDVTKARYEVKEKKSTTKKPKRRGLKGMESMDSDSE